MPKAGSYCAFFIVEYSHQGERSLHVMKFSWELNFTDFGFFKFWGNKFSGIWIADFTPGNKVLWISCTVLESN